jgi:hypothetical protein
MRERHGLGGNSATALRRGYDCAHAWSWVLNAP